MMDKMNRATRSHRLIGARMQSAARYMRQFKRDEDGSMIVFGLFLIVVMLIVGGMAVDFMRYEARRTLLQSTADRAALAGANLTNTENDEVEAVVLDYFAKAGLEGYLDGKPIIDNTDEDYRSVEVNLEQTLDTFFLRLAGVEEMDANASAIAIEGVGNVEISLVLDVSGSMGSPTKNEAGEPTSVTKIAALRTAATAFVDAVLADEYKDKITVSMVPYAQHVAIPQALFDGMTTEQRHDFSYCVDFADSDFLTTELKASQTYQQAQHAQLYGVVNSTFTNYLPDLTSPTCRIDTEAQISVLSNNRTTLGTQITGLQAGGSTSIFLGMKWGVALLDKSTRSLVAPFLPAGISGRPVDYPTSTNRIRSNKVIVLMTDGSNQPTKLLQDQFYDSESDIQYAGTNTFSNFWWTNVRTDLHPYNLNDDTGEFHYTKYTPTDGDTLLKNICDAAKLEKIEIFTIAFEAEPAGEAAMLDCATDSAHYYNASGSELTAIFEQIADQVTDLRLTK